MTPKVAAALDDVHPQMLRVQCVTDRKKLAEANREAIGQDVERTLGVIGLSKQEAAYAMEYSDAGTISRWCAGTERPQFDKLFALEGFEEMWTLIRARRNPHVRVLHVLEVEDRRTA